MSEETPAPQTHLPNRSSPRLPQQGGHRRGGRTQADRNAATFAALFGIGMMAFSFIGMVALILPQVRGLLLVLFGAMAFFAVHYALWGWWLPQYLQKQDRADPPAATPPYKHEAP